MGFLISCHSAIVGKAQFGTARALGISAVVVLVLAACGQKGNLVLPTEAAAKDRATLPQTLNPARSLPNAPVVVPAPAAVPTAPAPAASAAR